MMKSVTLKTLGRRELLTRSGPACAAACLGLASLPRGLAALAEGTSSSPYGGTQEQHKFDRPLNPPPPLTQRSALRMQYAAFAGLTQALRQEVGEEETVRIIKALSDSRGRQYGQAMAARFPDTSFRSFVAQFRPPNYEESMTHEVVVDTVDTFELKVTECVWAEVFRELGMAGEVGHAAVCWMDYSVPQAFNPEIRMERTKTLMQGHDCCDHRYLLNADGSGEAGI